MRARGVGMMMLAGALVGIWATPAGAQFFNSGSTGADGAFSPSCTPTPCTVDRRAAGERRLQLHDGERAVGVTVKYTRNAANTSVTMLATGAVTIAGTIDVSGANGGAGSTGVLLAPNRGVGGPGGFDGGNGTNGLAGSTGGGGLGPGGGGGGAPYGGLARAGGGGSYLTPGGQNIEGGAPGALYGTPTLVPLLGGSGGGGAAGWVGNSTGAGGGGGGGAIVIAAGTSAAATTITVNGAIKATGGLGGQGCYPPGAVACGGGGSGGAVRLTAHTLAGTGSVDVRGGTTALYTPPGGMGRIRVEYVTYAAALNLWQGGPPPTGVSSAAPMPALLTNGPTLTITSVGGVSAPGTLTGSFATPDFVLPAGTSTPTVTFAAGGIPLGTTLSVVVTGQTGGVISTATSGGLGGTVASSTASASVTIPTTQASLISASASFTVAAAGGGPLYAEGEPVERVVVTAHLGGGSEVMYVTASGRAIVMAAAR